MQNKNHNQNNGGYNQSSNYANLNNNGYATNQSSNYANLNNNGYAANPKSNYNNLNNNGYATNQSSNYANLNNNGYATNQSSSYANLNNNGYAANQSSNYANLNSNGYATNQSSNYANLNSNGYAANQSSSYNNLNNNGYASNQNSNYNNLNNNRYSESNNAINANSNNTTNSNNGYNTAAGEYDINAGNYDNYVAPKETLEQRYSYQPQLPGKDLQQNVKKEKKVRIVQTDEGKINGQDKCPKCGATDISLIPGSSNLRCNFCRHVFEPEKVDGFEENIEKLEGMVIASGAQDIQEDCEDIVTLKCTGCGAEVVIDTEEAMQSRCHWCRNTLSINQQIPNGSVPDVVLPFGIDKKEAQRLINNFVKKRRFFAHPRFKREFTTNNIMGVYFPYMMVDINGHAYYRGNGEHLVRKYRVRTGKSSDTRYDADLYSIEREFDIAIKGLTVESSTDKLSDNDSKTNNIINSIMPFDVENAVKWNANYLKGYTSEKRDTNISLLEPLVEEQSADISRFAANSTLEFYDRGVSWGHQAFDVKGTQWKAAHFPVWLYSYYQRNTKQLHYVAVNARTRETMGSVPINKIKLGFVSFLIEILCGYTAVQIDSEEGGEWILLSLGFVFFYWIYNKYRNKDARHTYELETEKKIDNVQKADKFVEHRKGLSNEKMRGHNNTQIKGDALKNKKLQRQLKK